MLKKIFKILLLFILVVVIGVCAIDAYMILKPQVESKKEIDGIETLAKKTDDLIVNEKAYVIGLGEASHGNKEFQELKLDVLKVLVRDYGLSAFAMEMSYGEGCIINDYINNKSNKTIDEVISNIVFDIYKTKQIKELIEWMKDYNDNSRDGYLSFYGFDMQNPNKDIEVIIDFLNKNNIDLNISYLKAYINNEFNYRDDKINDMYKQLDVIKNILNNDNYKDLYNYQRVLTCIDNIYLAKNIADVGSDAIQYGTIRDQQMAGRVIEIANYETSLGGRLMIAGHNGHVGYAGSYVKTMGKILKEELKEKYFVIGTDYYKTNCNIKNNDGSRSNHRFVSADILAYQAKRLGTYYLNFSDVDESSELNQYVNGPIYTGALGESYSILNKLLQDSVRIYCEPSVMYDAMIFVYEATPLELLNN